MIFDTDVLIWVQKGSSKAANLIDKEDSRYISIQTYMELLQSALNKQQLKITKSYLSDLGFSTLPFTENIGHRASIYVEQFSLSHSMRAGDAIIAATASENHMTLCSANAKYFKCIKDLDFKHFKPTLK